MCPSKKILSTFYDCEVEDKFCKQIEQHIKSCEKCFNYLQGLQNLSTKLKADTRDIDLPPIESILSKASSFGKNTDQLKTKQNFPNYKTYFRYSAIAAVVITISLTLIIPISLINKENSTSQIILAKELKVPEQVEVEVEEELVNDIELDSDFENPEILQPFNEYNKMIPVENR